MNNKTKDQIETKNVYFIGIGGIGMSALARYYKVQAYEVAGYDLTPSPITESLEAEGISVHFSEELDAIPASFFNKDETLVIYTPAVPNEHIELRYFIDNGYRVLKRSEALGEITRSSRALCVAGTHGKTTTSTMLAHLLYQSTISCNAFLGGIANNYNSNLLLSEKSDLVVVEADEYDRSFHRLSPYMAIITSADPDHLDIYGSPEAYRESFEHFTSLIRPGGVLLMKHMAPVSPRLQDDQRLFSYSANDPAADFYGSEIAIEDGKLFFTWHYPEGKERVQVGVPLRINVENAIAAMAIAYLNGVTIEEIARGIASFKGSQRRFDFVIDTEQIKFINDYAHHPVEIEASVRSVRELYPGKRILGIFQPHLYSRTADFHSQFAASLSTLDELILIDIYPARELPIPGITSQIILDQVQSANKELCSKENLIERLKERQLPDVILVLGAGDIDRLVQPIKEMILKQC